jgi:hypothetical protein
MAKHRYRCWAQSLSSPSCERVAVGFECADARRPTAGAAGSSQGRRATIPSPMLLQVLQRPDWHGTPIELGDLFRLQKNRREARAALFTHQLGWEVRLFVGSQLEVVQTQVCRDQEEVLRTGEQWKAAMIEKGWAANVWRTDQER